MRIWLMSDLHFEFMPDRGAAFCETLDIEDAEIVVLAGDLCAGKMLEESLARVCRAVAPVPVLYVLGNHEYYHNSMDETEDMARRAEKDNDNLFFLHRTSYTHKSRVFRGCTLWFDAREVGRHGWRFSDFTMIRGGDPNLFTAARLDRDFLDKVTGPQDVVITHHLPSYDLVADQYKGSDINDFFVHNCASLIQRAQPRLWLYGHTHTPSDRTLYGTRFVTQPLGYPRERSGRHVPHGRIIELT